jgi:hypothetical protein
VAIVTQITPTQDKFCSLTAAKVGRATELNSNTIKTFLDSGASEFMFTNESYAVGLEKYDTKIETARKGEFILGSRAGNVDAFLKDGKTKLGLKNKAIFSESFSDNLSSVGRLCETGVVCVFFKGKSVIFSEKNFHVSGEVLSEEPRDPVTGLYPLILLRGTTGATGAPSAPRIVARLIRAADMKNLTPSDWRLVDRRRTELAVEKFRCLRAEARVSSSGAGAALWSPCGIPLQKLAKIYVKEELARSPIERWHQKLAHIGTKELRKFNIEGLKIPKAPHRCTSCIRGKMHKLGHSRHTVAEARVYQPGECIHTDLQGPYVRSYGGHKYSQIFLDMGSKYVWRVPLSKKTDSASAIRRVLNDAFARSGQRCRYLRTDGDGIFGRSAAFQALKEEFKFVHERPAPYDHQQSAHIDRECRTLLEGVATSLIHAGAPAFLERSG